MYVTDYGIWIDVAWEENNTFPSEIIHLDDFNIIYLKNLPINYLNLTACMILNNGELENIQENIITSIRKVWREWTQDPEQFLDNDIISW